MPWGTVGFSVYVAAGIVLVGGKALALADVREPRPDPCVASRAGGECSWRGLTTRLPGGSVRTASRSLECG